MTGFRWSRLGRSSVPATRRTPPPLAARLILQRDSGDAVLRAWRPPAARPLSAAGLRLLSSAGSAALVIPTSFLASTPHAGKVVGRDSPDSRDRRAARSRYRAEPASPAAAIEPAPSGEPRVRPSPNPLPRRRADQHRGDDKNKAERPRASRRRMTERRPGRPPGARAQSALPLNSVRRRAVTVLVAGAPWSPWLAPSANARSKRRFPRTNGRLARRPVPRASARPAATTPRSSSSEADRIQPRPELSFDIAVARADDDVAAVVSIGSIAARRIIRRRAEVSASKAGIATRVPAPGWDPTAALASSSTGHCGLLPARARPTRPAGDRAADDSSKVLPTMVGRARAARRRSGAPSCSK